MRSDLSKFTLRIDSELLKKFHIVADYNVQSATVNLSVL